MAGNNDKAVANGLAAQVEQAKRAQEVIDRDPGEAQAKLAPVTKVTDGSELTMQDMMGLFLQLSAQQTRMQEQLVDLLSHERKKEERASHATRAEMERMAAKRAATIEFWANEPKEPVWIEPNPEEVQLAGMHKGEMPPRMLQINGIQYPVPVGRIVEVPASIAALVRRTQGSKTKPHQPIESIENPPRGQFLQGSAQTSVGYSGKAGEGPLHLSYAARTPAEAHPLGQSYDHLGR